MVTLAFATMLAFGISAPALAEDLNATEGAQFGNDELQTTIIEGTENTEGTDTSGLSSQLLDDGVVLSDVSSEGGLLLGAPESSEGDGEDDIIVETYGTLPETPEGAVAIPESGTDDTYLIQCDIANNRVVDAASKTPKDGSNVGTYTYNGGDNQQWKAVQEETTLWYRLLNASDETLALGVDESGNTIVMSVTTAEESEETLQAILWAFLDAGNENSYNIYNCSTKKVLDIEKGKKDSGANIVVWDKKDGYNANQAFRLVKRYTVTAGVEDMEGAYTLMVKGSDVYVDVSGQSKDNCADVELWTATGGKNQTIYLESAGDGFYYMWVEHSGKVIDVSGNLPLLGTNVLQYEFNGNDNQKWAVYKSGDSYTFVNKATGLALGGSSTDKGTSLVGVAGDAGISFVATLKALLTEGIYEIHPRTKVTANVDIKAANNKATDKTSVILWTDNDALNQRYQLVSAGETNVFRIRTGSSGGWITTDGTDVYQTGKGSDAKTGDNTWKVTFRGGWYGLWNEAHDVMFDMKGGSTADGALIIAWESNGRDSQHFTFEKTGLIKGGMYYINSAYLTDGSARVLDVAGSSKSDGGNIITWTSTKGANQKFTIQVSGDHYKIINFNSGMAVTAGGTAQEDGNSNVYQSTSSSSDYQLWDAVIGYYEKDGVYYGGYIDFVNVATGKHLFSLYNTSGKTNVVEKAANSGDGAGYCWKLVRAGGWSRVNGHWFYSSDDPRAEFEKLISPHNKNLNHFDVLHQVWLYVNGKVSGSNQSFHSKTGYLICSSWDDCYVCIFKGTANSTKADNWEPLFGWNCGNGSAKVIEGKVKEKNPSSTWKWDPNWNRYLAEGNVKGNVPELEPQDKWAASLDTTWSGSRRNPIKKGSSEKYFTSISWTLGYHTTITSNPSKELGQHCSNGCQRLTEAHAKWIYDNIGPGTRVMQCTYKRLETAK